MVCDAVDKTVALSKKRAEDAWQQLLTEMSAKTKSQMALR
jgi:hypothetical protein